MKIFAEDINIIRKEIELIKDSLIKTSPRQLTDNIEVLEAFYQIMYELSGEEDEETIDILLKNKKLRELKADERQRLHKKNIKNFIQNKEMHKMVSGRILDLYDKDFKYFIPKRLYLREEQMAEIICDFFDAEFNQADKFIEFSKKGNIFRSGISDDEGSTMETAGYTMYDYINKNSIVVVTNDPIVWDVNMMRVIVHEFGHVVDNFDRDNASRKDNSRYFWLSSYAEVYSMLYEKLFFDYLIKNNIFRENASTGLKKFYMEIYDSFNSVEYLSSLSDVLLTNERYKNENNLVDQIQVDENGSPYIASAVFDNFNETKLYSYGGIFATYFADLKHNDPDLFNKRFIDFKNRRFGLFDFKIFEDIGTNIDEIINIYDKNLDEMTNTKKLIFK